MSAADPVNGGLRSYRLGVNPLVLIVLSDHHRLLMSKGRLLANCDVIAYCSIAPACMLQQISRFQRGEEWARGGERVRTTRYSPVACCKKHAALEFDR